MILRNLVVSLMTSQLELTSKVPFMKNLLLVAVILSISACSSMVGKPSTQKNHADDENLQRQQIMRAVSDKGHNGVTRIQRGNNEFGFVLELDSADADMEVVILDISADAYIKKLEGAASLNGFVDPAIYIKKAELDIAVNYLMKAQTLAYSDELIPALELVERALQISPASTQALSIHGSIMLQLGKKDAAIKSWETALGYDSTLTELKAHLESIN